MSGKRRLHHESLESRRLLAAECELTLDASTEGVTAPAAVIAGNARLDIDPALGRSIAPFHEFFGFVHGPDLVHEDGDRIFVVDQHPFSPEGGGLFVFERTSSGELETVAEIEVGFPVERMIVNGDQVLMFGNNFNWLTLSTDRLVPDPAAVADQIAPHLARTSTIVLTVNLGEEVEVIDQQLDGLFHQVHQRGDQLAIVSSIHDAQIAVFPPPLDSGRLTIYDITADGLTRVAGQTIPLFGMSEFHESFFYHATSKPNDIVFLTPDNLAAEPGPDRIRAPEEPPQPTVSLSQFSIGDDGIEELQELELGPGFLMHLDVSPDGLTAIAVRTAFNGAGPVTSVDLISLAEGEMRIFETIEIPEFSGVVLTGGPEFVALRGFEHNDLIVIDANQSIDLAAENRIRRIDIPDNLRLRHEALEVNHDRLVIRAHRTLQDESGEAVTSRLSVLPDTRDTILLTISLSRAEIIADTHFEDDLALLPYEGLFLIDAESQRLGVLARLETGTADSRIQFLFGHLNDEGDFVRDGSIPVGRWLEIDANADRLIVREHDRLLEYDWENTDQPIITPLGEPETTIEAVNDEYILNANEEEHVLDVLANDVIHHPLFAPTEVQIVELVGAPDGASIVEGHAIRIPGEALQNVDRLRFEYVISNGREESTAVVEIDVRSINEDEVEELVRAVREQAAEDFEVSVEEITITSVERIFTEPLPIVLPDGTELNFSPGILVTLTAPNATAMYAATLEGEIIQVFASQREALVELGLRAIDDEGETLDQVTEGQEFWLEFNAKDLRPFGLGVYAAFLDLVVPTEHLVITGPIESGPGLSQLPGGEFNEGELNDVGALHNQIKPTGNERQQILRIGVRAVSAGEIVLQPEPADASGTETLIRGRDFEVPSDLVRYVPLPLKIVSQTESDPLDADGNGRVSAADALVVINFLGDYGTMTLDELASAARGGGEGESPPADLAKMRRYDTNRSGTISALDALVVINNLEEVFAAAEAAPNDEETISDAAEAPIEGIDGNNLF